MRLMEDTKPSSGPGVCIGLYRSFTFVLLSSCEKFMPRRLRLRLHSSTMSVILADPQARLLMVYLLCSFSDIPSSCSSYQRSWYPTQDPYREWTVFLPTLVKKLPAFCVLFQPVRYPSSGMCCTFSIMWALE